MTGQQSRQGGLSRKIQANHQYFVPRDIQDDWVDVTNKVNSLTNQTRAKRVPNACQARAIGPRSGVFIVGFFGVAVNIQAIVRFFARSLHLLQALKAFQ